METEVADAYSNNPNYGDTDGNEQVWFCIRVRILSLKILIDDQGRNTSRRVRDSYTTL